MKIVTANKPATPKTPRRNGQVTEFGGKYAIAIVRPGYSMPMAVNLTDMTIATSQAHFLADGEVECPNAVFLPDGLPPVPVPPVKSREQHAREFITWYWGNTHTSGASNITIYTVGEILEERTNANCRRAFASWLAARGV